VTSTYGADSLMEFNASGTFVQVLNAASAFPATQTNGLAYMIFDTTAPATESTVVLAQDTVGAPYNQSITPNGGTGAVTLSVTNVANAITGLNITGNATGSVSITGTPTATGTETFTVTATDSLGGTTTTDYTLTVNPAPTLSGSLPGDTTNVAYNQSISATGGTGSVMLAVSNISNAIPGLSITGSGTTTGLTISGTPTAAGTETFTVTGTDGAGGTTGAQQYSITVNPALTLSNTTTQAVFVTSYVTNAVYEFDANTGALLQTLVAPNSQSILSSPAAITVGPDGNLYITGESGEDNITEYNFSTKTLSVFISGAQLEAANGGVPFAPGGIAFGPDGNLYTDNTIHPGVDQVLRLGITTNDGQLSYNGINSTIAILPLTLACDIMFGANPGDQGNLYVSDDNSVVKITGATTAAPTSSYFVSPGEGGLGDSCGVIWHNGDLYVTDPVGNQVLEYDASGNFLGVFASLPGQVPINTLFLPDDGAVTSTYGADSLMEFNASGTFVQVLNAASAFPATQTNGLAYMVFDTTAPATESTVVLAQDTINAPYNQSITPNGGTGAVTLSVTNVANAIPGLNITGKGTGSVSITGTPTATGTETFTVTATDSLGSTTTTDYTFTVNPAPTLSPGALPGDTVNVAYNQSISAAGGTGSIMLAVSNISNPIPGLSITGSGSTTGLSITGTPTVAGTETFTVTGTDGAGGTTGSQQYSVTANPAGTLTLSTVTQPPGAINSTYGPIAINVSGGFGAYTFTLATGSKLPPGLSLSGGSSGSLGGIPTAAGAFAFTIVATDNHTPTLTGQLHYTMTITSALVASPANLPIATVGNPFSAQLKATGGSGAGYVFAASSLPDGLTLSSAGLLYGVPTTAAVTPFDFTVTLTDSNNVSRNFSYALRVDPALAVNPGSLPVATVGDKFSTHLTATGGSGKGYAFTTTALPSWLTLSGTGLLSGTPPATAQSSASFTVTLTDSVKGTASTGYMLRVDPALVLSPTTLTVVTVGNAFGTQLTAAGGSGAGYSFTGVNLPGWISVSPDGLLSGTPTTATGSPFHFTITATDSDGGTVRRNYSLAVNPALGVKPIPLPTATVGDNYSVQLTALGGSGMGYAFTASGLPGWLTLSSTGQLTGMPPAPTLAPLNFTVTVIDSNGATGSLTEALTVDPALTLNPSSLPTATVGDKFSTHLTATGGSGKGYVFTGSALPAWLTLSRTGLLSGTPPATAESLASFTVTVTDSVKGTASTGYMLSVDPALVISPTTLTVVTMGNAFRTQLTAAGGSGAGYTFTGVNLPGWMSLSKGGLLTGTPTTATGSPFHFTVTATDSDAGTVSRNYSLAVNPALGVKPIPLPTATAGDNYSTQLTALGGSGKGYAFTASGLPGWLTLSSTGLLSGIPPAPTVQPLSFTVTVTDSNGATGSLTEALTVDPALTLNPNSLPTATVGDKFSTQLTATGGSGAGYVFTSTGLPTWLKLSSRGLLSGTPKSVTGSPLRFTVTVTDSVGGTVSNTFSLTVIKGLGV
jgi:hypothetical protein